MKLRSKPAAGRSLPPEIDGHIYGSLAVEISRMLWMIPDPPSDIVVRVKWWGETGNSICLRPAKGSRFLVSNAEFSAATIARYEVRCGPKQFAAYLRDAGHLDMEVLANNSVLGRVTVPNLVLLSEGKAINNYFSIVKQNGGKIGRLHIHIVMKELDGNRKFLSAGAETSSKLESQIGRHLEVPLPAKPPVHYKLDSTARTQLRIGKAKNEQKSTRPLKSTAIKSKPGVRSGPRSSNHSAVPSHQAGNHEENVQTKWPSAVFNANKYHDTPSAPSTAFDEKWDFPLDVSYAFLEGKKDVGIDLDKTAIQTILGDNLSASELRTAKILSGFTDSESEDDSVFSDLDPVRDSSILESLFYQKTSEHAVNEIEVGEEQSRPPKAERKKVAFDTDAKLEKKIGGGVFKLSAERIALLKKVHFVRVLVDHLTVATNEDAENLVGSKGSRTDKCRTCTLDYCFPGKALQGNRTFADLETVRITAKKVEDNVISYNHRSVFPITFNTTTIKQWWNSAVQFRVFTRKDNEKAPLGCASLHLSSVLESPSFAITAHLLLKPPVKTKHIVDNRLQEMGHRLKVKVELASDVRGFYSSLALLRRHSLPASTSTSSAKKQDSKQDEPIQVELEVKKRFPGPKLSPSLSNIEKTPKMQPEVTVPKSIAIESDTPIPLHAFLSVSQGIGFIAPVFYYRRKYAKRIKRHAGKFHGRITRNLYLECRIFDRMDVARSSVCWSSLNPPFNFKLVAPFFLSEAFLERAWNNYTVIEVWDKLPSARDQLVGICKLPLHQFYLSFCKRAMVQSLLRSELPVIAVDGFLRVMDVVTHREMGQLQVTLALGSPKQIQNLQNQLQHQSHDENHIKVTVPEKVPDLVEDCEASPSTEDSEEIQIAPGEVKWDADVLNDIHPVDATCEEEVDEGCHPLEMVSHTFSVTMEGIQGLQLPSDLIWGEADCFVTYDFPSGLTNGQLGIQFCQSAAVICTPNVVFKDSRHVSFDTTQEQRQQLPALLQKACPSGIVFSVWCRRYSPSAAQNVIATASFPLSRLCALITMWNQGEPDPKLSSSLPLFVTHKGDHQVDSAGLLSVAISYSSKKTGLIGTSLSSVHTADSSVNRPGHERAFSSEPDNRPNLVNTDLRLHDNTSTLQRLVTGTASPVSRAAVPGIPREAYQESLEGTTDADSLESVAASDENSFRAELHIEQASRLSRVCSKERANILPNTYVTCDLNDVDSIITPVIEASDSPQWDWQQAVVLPAKLLTDENAALVFKVWHTEADSTARCKKFARRISEQLLGLVRVDLVTLVLGLDQITGWYNILSYDNECRGQLKVSVSPLDDVSHFREKRVFPTDKKATKVEMMIDEDNLSRSWLVNHLRHSLEELENFRTQVAADAAKTQPRSDVPRTEFESHSNRSSVPFVHDPEYLPTHVQQKVEWTNKVGLQSTNLLSKHSWSLPNLPTYTDSSSSETVPSLPDIARCSSSERIHRCSLSDIETVDCATWDSHSCCKHSFADIQQVAPVVNERSQRKNSPSEIPRRKKRRSPRAQKQGNVLHEQRNICDPLSNGTFPRNRLTTNPDGNVQGTDLPFNSNCREEIIIPNVLNSHSMVNALDRYVCKEAEYAGGASSGERITSNQNKLCSEPSDKSGHATDLPGTSPQQLNSKHVRFFISDTVVPENEISSIEDRSCTPATSSNASSDENLVNSKTDVSS